MNKLQEAGAAIGFGLVSYGLMHLTPSPDIEIQHHAAAVEVCSREMGGEGRYTDDLPRACDEFAAQLDPMSFLFIGGSTGDGGTGRFYLPPYDEFTKKVSYTPSEISAKEAMHTVDAYVLGACGAMAMFGATRTWTYFRKGGKAETSTSQPPRIPKPRKPNVLLTEDSPEWPVWVHEHGL